jgi:hypothetical protein
MNTDTFDKPDLTLKETADVIRMSERWLRQQIADGVVECERRGHKIFFNPAQVEKLRKSFTTNAVPTSITTGRKRKAS